MPKLYIIGTPIGNLKDVTLRALEVLKDADAVFAEDTRVSKKLLAHYGIQKPVFRYFTGRKYPFEKFQNIAFLTDAGTPAISDPGKILVEELLKKNFEIIAVPGPSALSAMISVSDIDLADFVFLGFPPSKKGRQKFFSGVAGRLENGEAVILFESPHRFLKTLKEIFSSAGDIYINVGRELTKMHEEVFRGKISEATKKYESGARGEFVLVLSPK